MASPLQTSSRSFSSLDPNYYGNSIVPLPHYYTGDPSVAQNGIASIAGTTQQLNPNAQPSPAVKYDSDPNFRTSNPDLYWKTVQASAGGAAPTTASQPTTPPAPSYYPQQQTQQPAAPSPAASLVNSGIQMGEGAAVKAGANAAGDALGTTGGTVLGGLGAAYGAYNAINDIQHGGSGRTGLTEAGAGLGTMALPGIGTAAGAIGGNILGYGLQGNGWKNDAALVAMGPIGLSALAAKKLGILGHETTKQTEANRWSGVAKAGADDPKYQQEVSTLYNSAHGPNADDSKWTPEVQAAAMKDPTSMWGEVGMLQAFGEDYFNKMNEFQRYAATQYAIDHGLLKADHGDIIVTDPEALKAALPEFSANKDYQTAYNTWKKTEGAAAPAAGAGGGGISFQGISNAIAAQQAAASGAMRKQQTNSNLVNMLNGSMSGMSNANSAGSGFSSAFNDVIARRAQRLANNGQQQNSQPS